jgi:hypothetical protein
MPYLFCLLNKLDIKATDISICCSSIFKSNANAFILGRGLSKVQVTSRYGLSLRTIFVLYFHRNCCSFLDVAE